MHDSGITADDNHRFHDITTTVIPNIAVLLLFPFPHSPLINTRQ